MKRLGEGVTIISGSGRRPIFEVEGQIFAEGTLEEAIKKRIREYQFLGEQEHEAIISRLLAILKTLGSDPDKLTTDQCDGLVTILREQSQRLSRVMNYLEQLKRIDDCFIRAGIPDEILNKMSTNPYYLTLHSRVEPEIIVTSGVRNVLAMLDREAKRRALDLSFYVNNSCPNEIARMELMMLQGGGSPPLLSPGGVLAENELGLSGPRSLLELQGLTFTSGELYGVGGDLNVGKALDSLTRRPEESKTDGDLTLDQLIQSSLLSQQISSVLVQIADRTGRNILNGIEPAVATFANLFLALTRLRLIRKLYDGTIGDPANPHDFDKKDFHDEDFAQIVVEELDAVLSPQESGACERMPIDKTLVCAKLNSLRDQEREEILNKAYARYLERMAELSGYISHVSYTTTDPKKAEFSFRHFIATDFPTEPNKVTSGKTNVFDDLAEIALVWTRIFETSVFPTIIEVAQIDLLRGRLKEALDKYDGAVEMLSKQYVSSLKESETAQAEYNYRRAQLLSEFSNEVKQAHEICRTSTQSLLQKRGQSSIVRDDLQERLGLISSQLLSKIAKSVSYVCSDDNAGKFRLNFREGGAKVTLAGQDLSHLAQSATDAQKWLYEAADTVKEKDPKGVDLQRGTFI